MGEKKGGKRRKRGNSSGQKGSIGGQSLRVWGSIWKATLCLALYCTPCCFNQWQACSQSLEQKWLFFIVLLLAQRFLLHYTPALLTKSLKSGAALSALSKSRGNVFTCSAGKGPICSWWFDTLLAPALHFFFYFTAWRDESAEACCVELFLKTELPISSEINLRAEQGEN